MSTLEEIKQRHPTQSVLSVEEIAQEIARSPKAVRGLIERGGIPKIKKIGGRVCITLTDLAEWLDQGDQPKTKPAKTPVTPPVTPPRRLPSMLKTIMAARTQAEFLNDLANALEAIELKKHQERNDRQPKPRRELNTV